jgi:hypothetical protein
MFATFPIRVLDAKEIFIANGMFQMKLFFQDSNQIDSAASHQWIQPATTMKFWV